MVNYDYSAIPLHAALACFRPFVQFFTRKFFENEFIGTETYPVEDENGDTYLTFFIDKCIEDEKQKNKEELWAMIMGIADGAMKEAEKLAAEGLLDKGKKKEYMVTYLEVFQAACHRDFCRRSYCHRYL